MIRIFRTTAATVAAVMLMLANFARADVLAQVPGDALFVIKVNSLKGTSDKFARFATDLGVAAMVQQLQDPLTALQDQMGIKEGLNANGDFAFAFIDPAVTGEAGPEGSMVMLIPVSDYDAFLNKNSFTDVATDGAVTSFTMPMAGHTSYAAKWGDYAALTPAKDVLSIKPTGLKVSGVAGKELSKDIVFFANLPKLKTLLQPALKDGRENILAEMEQELQNEPEVAKFAPVIKALVGRALDVADSFLRDANAATVAVNFVPEGLNVAVVAEFDQGTYLGNLTNSLSNSNQSFTKGLPAGKYLLFGGSTGDPEQTAKLLNDLAGPVLEELRKVGGEQATAIDALYGNMLKFVKAANGYTFGMMAPQGELGASALLQGASIYFGDANVMKTAYTDMAKGQEQLMTAFGMPAEQFQYSITPGGRTVGGVTFDVVTSNMKLDPADPSAAQVEQMMKFLYGPEGMKFLIGVVDDKTLVQSFGLDDAALGQVLTALKAGDDSLAGSAGVKAVNAHLPSAKNAVVYIPVDEVVSTGLNVAKQFGFAVNVQMQPELPPVGVSIATDGTALRIDGHAPTQLISQLIAAGFQIGMQMQGGPGGGQRRGPGGL